MSSYFLELTKRHQRQLSLVERWCLDAPGTESYTATELAESGVLFQGWLLTRSRISCRLELRQGQQSTFFNRDLSRPDVVRTILKQPAAGHSQLHCGFYFRVSLVSADFSLWLHQDGQQELLVQGKVLGKQNVLQGERGWLFLDNDTNNSVEQHQGKLLLSPQALGEWQSYFSRLHQSCQLAERPHCVLIAPTKEAVYPQFHPLPRASKTPVDQLQRLCGDLYPLVYPVADLQTEDPYSFLRTDTHWSTHGAKQGTVAALSSLGLNEDELVTLFANDSYRRAYKIGDLGGKLYPQQGADEWVPASFSMHSVLVYDNGLPNFGRVMLFDKADAMLSSRCLIFGSSSSYSMLNYLCRVFKEVVFVHTAGNVDTALLEWLQPDYLLCQTNERYVVRAPVVGYALQDVIREKVTQLVDDEMAVLVSKQQAQLQRKPAPKWAQEVINWLVSLQQRARASTATQ